MGLVATGPTNQSSTYFSKYLAATDLSSEYTKEASQNYNAET